MRLKGSYYYWKKKTTIEKKFAIEEIAKMNTNIKTETKTFLEIICNIMVT